MMNFTKTIMVLLLLMTLGSAAHAAQKSDRDVEKLNRRAEPIFLSMKGFVGAGVQVCDTSTGELLNFDRPKSGSETAEACSVVYVESQEAGAALQAVFPMGTRIQGIIIAVSVIGKINLN